MNKEFFITVLWCFVEPLPTNDCCEVPPSTPVGGGRCCAPLLWEIGEQDKNLEATTECEQHAHRCLTSFSAEPRNNNPFQSSPRSRKLCVSNGVFIEAQPPGQEGRDKGASHSYGGGKK